MQDLEYFLTDSWCQEILRKSLGSWLNLLISCTVPSNRIVKEICRIWHKSRHDPGDLGSCRILTGKIQEVLGMRLGKSPLIIELIAVTKVMNFLIKDYSKKFLEASWKVFVVCEYSCIQARPHPGIKTWLSLFFGFESANLTTFG